MSKVIVGQKPEKHPQDHLCADCLKLDLYDGVLKACRYFNNLPEINSDVELKSRRNLYKGGKSYHTRQDSFYICSFSRRLLNESECRLCSFFRKTRLQLDDHQDWKLLAFRSTSSFHFRESHLKTWLQSKGPLQGVFLSVVPDMDFMAPNEYDLFWVSLDMRSVGTIHLIASGDNLEIKDEVLRPRRLDPTADLSIVSGWLSFCESHHGTRCAPRKFHDNTLQYLRVIDCKHEPPRLATRPFTDKYAALSYVWGPGLPDPWPRVVLDAVEVTRRLGLEYLWVDRLCIDQDNPKEKHYLISKMASIYECSEFTIVAAAGSDAAYGLPGIRTGKIGTRNQAYVQIGAEICLVSSLTDPRLTIKDSTWSTRGWTYQEGVLSNRRLVFTNEQMYFECGGMAAQETLDLPLQLFHKESGEAMEDFMLAGVFNGSSEAALASIASFFGFPNLKSPGLSRGLLLLDEHIATFTSKNLSYNEDSLLAFSGIAERYGSRNGIGILLGLPFWTGGCELWGPSVLYSFALSLSSWSHARIDETGYSQSGMGVRRRIHLPSWTWAGWKGTISWNGAGSSLHNDATVRRISTSNPTPEGERIIVYSPDMTLQQVSGEICMRLSELDSLGDAPQGCQYQVWIQDPLVLDPGRIEKWEGPTFRGNITLSLELPLPELIRGHETGDILSVLTYADNYGLGCVLFIVLRRNETDSAYKTWERIGTLSFQRDTKDLRSWSNVQNMLESLPVMACCEVVVVC